MAVIVTRAGKGSPLTNNEVDANFLNLNTELGTRAAAGANSDITSLSGITGGISTVGFAQFDTAITPTVGVGKLQWDPTEGGLQVGMVGGNVNLQVGQETVIYVYNNTGSALVDGQVVYCTGSQGQRLTVALAQANADATSATIIGVVTEPIANNASGFITVQGTVHGIDTSGFSDGAVIYLSPTTPGAWTATKPVAPQHMVMVGYVVKGGSVGAGSIYIHAQNGYELDELHDVLITSKANLDLLQYDSTATVWKNVAPSTVTVGFASVATNLQNGGANRIPYNTASSTTSYIAAPTTSGAALTWTGTAFDWIIAGAASITDDTATNATYYPTFATASSGTFSTAKVSSTKLTFNPSTGTLTATTVTGSSDESLKTNWQDFSADFVDQLAGVKHGIFDRIAEGTTEVGVSAQSLRKVMSQAVVQGADGLLSVNYGGAAMVSAIQLAKRLVALEATVAKLVD